MPDRRPFDLSELLSTITHRDGNAQDKVVFRMANDIGSYQADIFTAGHVYHIIAKYPAPGKPEGYLGCYGQWHSRAQNFEPGDLLLEGPFSFDTWFRIGLEIVACELVVP